MAKKISLMGFFKNKPKGLINHAFLGFNYKLMLFISSPIGRKENCEYADKNNRPVYRFVHRILHCTNHNNNGLHCAVGFGRARHQPVSSTGKETW